MNKSNCCEKCSGFLEKPGAIMPPCANVMDCECHQKATTHEIEGWEKEFRIKFTRAIPQHDEQFRSSIHPQDIIYFIASLLKQQKDSFENDPMTKDHYTGITHKALNHQQERIIAALEGMKIPLMNRTVPLNGPEHEAEVACTNGITGRNGALTEAIEVVRSG